MLRSILNFSLVSLTISHYFYQLPSIIQIFQQEASKRICLRQDSCISDFLVNILVFNLKFYFIFQCFVLVFMRVDALKISTARCHSKFIYLFIYLFDCLFIYSFIHLYIYLFNALIRECS